MAGESNRSIQLELEEDLEHEHRQWTVERIGWTVMLLLGIAALLGLLGHGPLSRTSVESSDKTVRVEYYRFEREAAPSDLKVTTRSAPTADGFLRIWIDRTYLDLLDIDAVTPEPQRVEAHPHRLVFVFPVAPGPADISVRFRYQARSPAMTEARIGIDAGGEVSFTQIIYP